MFAVTDGILIWFYHKNVTIYHQYTVLKVKTAHGCRVFKHTRFEEFRDQNHVAKQSYFFLIIAQLFYNR